MSAFIQLHLLTSYPPANLNRDDLGRPKTAVMGGVQRLRVSSQSLKRAWRTSDLFKEALTGHIGVRTKEMGVRIFKQLHDEGIGDSDAKRWAKEIAGQFGKCKDSNKDKPLQELKIEQLAHFSPEEIKAIDDLVREIIANRRKPHSDELCLLRSRCKAADISLFGRMLADRPRFNIEAAAQVAHAITVHKVAVEDDYFTAVDDLNDDSEEMGAAHIGEMEFAAGLFYLYICINRDLLIENLNGDEEIANKTIRALIECAATIAPGGKQNSFASRAYASYLLAEKGSRQPRSLSVAFLKPISGSDMLNDAITALQITRENMDRVYGAVAAESYALNAAIGEGSLNGLLDFISAKSKQE